MSRTAIKAELEALSDDEFDRLLEHPRSDAPADARERLGQAELEAAAEHLEDRLQDRVAQRYPEEVWRPLRQKAYTVAGAIRLDGALMTTTAL
jgi:hypothetical protein